MQGEARIESETQKFKRFQQVSYAFHITLSELECLEGLEYAVRFDLQEVLNGFASPQAGADAAGAPRLLSDCEETRENHLQEAFHSNID